LLHKAGLSQKTMRKGKLITKLVQNLGKRFSTSLGIDLSEASSIEIFKWFLASILFGARISESIVVKTYRQFEKESILSCQKILDTGWDGLVRILDNGGYVRYDFKTATKLLEVMGGLQKQYMGDLNQLHQEAKDSFGLEKKLKHLGKGIGEVTVNIFLRELRGTWEKANPYPGKLVLLAAKNLGLCSSRKSKKEILAELKSLYEKNPMEGKTFVDFETALLRLGKDFCRKGKCADCMVKSFCKEVGD
jgi:endonuclease III